MEKEKRKEILIKVFWVFIIGSFIGCIVEMMVCLVQKGHFELRQGVIYGPFLPVYGMGAVVYFFTIPKIKGTGKVFLASMILGGVTEYLFSYFQERWFGTVSWDYSHLWFNVNGRTSLLHCLYWGGAGILFVKLVYPFLNRLIDKFKTKQAFRYVTATFVIFMFFNMCISSVAANRQYERMQNIAATTSLDQLMDQYYPDYLLNTIYSNKIVKMSIK